MFVFVSSGLAGLQGQLLDGRQIFPLGAAAAATNQCGWLRGEMAGGRLGVRGGGDTDATSIFGFGPQKAPLFEQHVLICPIVFRRTRRQTLGDAGSRSIIWRVAS
jgi:hypothetical protein